MTLRQPILTTSRALLPALLVFSTYAVAQTPMLNFTTLYTWYASPFSGPYYSGVVVGTGGVLYGTTFYDGANGYGSVYSLTPPATPGEPWTPAVIYSFGTNAGDGANPNAGVVIGEGGVLYGTTSNPSGGAVFSLTPPVPPATTWTETVLYSFGTNGAGDALAPGDAGVVVGAGGVLYGTTWGGGTVCNDGYSGGCGTVYSLTPPASSGGAWTERVRYRFRGHSKADGAVPRRGVVIGGGGVLYGATQYGGSAACGGGMGCGTVFSLTPPNSPGGSWTEAVLHSFSGTDALGSTDGGDPLAGVTIGSGGVLYGTTNVGGANGGGTVYSLTPPSSSEPSWTENLLCNFPTGNSPYSPQAGVVIGSGGVLYGTSVIGGAATTCADDGCGTVYSVTPPKSTGDSWTDSVLYSFTGGIDGKGPTAGVVIGEGGVLYGVSNPAGNGVVFSLGPAPTTTTVTSSRSPAFLGQPVKFTAAVASSFGAIPNGELVTFYDSATEIGTGRTEGGAATMTTPSLTLGTHGITATYSGDSSFESSTSAVYEQTINADPTATLLTASANPSAYGQAVAFTATVTSSISGGPTAAGTVTFKNGTSVVGTATLDPQGSAVFTTSTLGAGTYSITAAYSGDASLAKSVSAPLAQTVDPAATATQLISSVNPSAPGESVTFTAIVTCATTDAAGLVTFTSGATVLGTSSLVNGSAKLAVNTLLAGASTLTATYAGNVNVKGSAASIVQNVE
ncbi:MAG: Ig-like domain-containing protein [Bryobacteraceae bacterium]